MAEAFKRDDDVIVVNAHRVACDGLQNGAEASLGHPRVFIELSGPEPVRCKYCDQMFKQGAH